jgi:hypothetical protein
MKKTMALAILLAAGAGSAQAQLQTTPLYPLKIGTRWTYDVTAGKEAPAKDDVKKIVTIEVEREEPYSRKKKGADGKDVTVKNTGFILKMTSGAKVTRDHVVVLEDGVYKVHVAGTQINPPLCVIKLGTTGPWEADSKSGNTTVKGSFSVRAVGVKVPAGTFKDAFLISFNNNINGDDRIEIDSWYVVDVGMVRMRVLQKGHENVLELEKYEPAK